MRGSFVLPGMGTIHGRCVVEEVDRVTFSLLSDASATCLTCSGQLSRPRGELEPELGRDDDAPPEGRQGLADQLLVREGTVGLGGVEERDAAFDGGPEERDHAPRRGRLEQRVEADGAREMLGRRLLGRLRAASLEVHFRNCSFRRTTLRYPR
jgi:hypothetical protein